MSKNYANIITILRIPFSAALLFTKFLGIPFFVLYSLCGLTDMADGIVARATGTVSETGQRLDSAADLIFAAVCLVKILPMLELKPWIWAGIGAVAAVKAATIIRASNKKIPLPHTIPDKLTGLALFALPFTLKTVAPEFSTAALCVLALFASLHEGYVVYRRKA